MEKYENGLILISLLKEKILCGGKHYYVFNYHGYLYGREVKDIFMSCKTHKLKVGNEYLIHTNLIRFDGKKMIANIIKTKDLEYLKADIF